MPDENGIIDTGYSFINTNGSHVEYSTYDEALNDKSK